MSSSPDSQWTTDISDEDSCSIIGAIGRLDSSQRNNVMGKDNTQFYPHTSLIQKHVLIQRVAMNIAQQFPSILHLVLKDRVIEFYDQVIGLTDMKKSFVSG
eukprot:12004373-Ditylum_brightwellii.AAC.1